ncbi:MAG: phenylalanine--tRNA ligase subunit beta [Bauldia sp.]|uniref:phenylalanine--tRNA ligase subunit beta n=1 Tax=Bauldia sp. TaxID=2575872 RepID=UPI001DAD78FA|nr:phenylalanine--tRNA ligase subunit beta [Bauldia sp.]MCB1496436.1 phenylalanine--tRNA ligase subunit beta [Bauldia sp.]
MKFTLSWLKEHLDTIATVDGIADKLTMIGLEVEGVEDLTKDFAPFRIARVVSAEPHPNADRLRVCVVDPGDGSEVQVVCGAPNARAGMKGVFAPAGTRVPGTGVDLKKGVIRGVESNGMLLSERELGLSDDHTGIVDLPEDAPVGTPYADYAGLDDPVFDVAITPNRPDALGVTGIARDLAAAGEGRAILRPVEPVKGDGPCPVSVALDFGDAPSLCPAFGLRLVRGVKNGPSPEWLQQRLRSIGLRPINVLVDITNFITHDRCRPLHVFDAAKVFGSLVVRRARDGEEILALDGKTYALDPEMCVIADDRGVESLAGIMGGEDSGCTEDTVDVLIESALWEPLNIAQTGRRLGVQSDARHRFERGVDPAFMIPGLEMATRMVMELCGGSPSDLFIAGEVPEPATVIDFPVAEIKRLTGIDPSVSDATRILEDLGFGCRPHRTEGSIVVSVPSWRPDVAIKADLVEEVVRIIGVDRVPVTPLRRDPGSLKPVLTTLQTRTRAAKRALAARGMVEAVTWSFISSRQTEAFGGGQPELILANPIAADMSDMRPSLLPGLIAATQRNADRGFDDLALFEVGQVYGGDRPDDQRTAATGVRRGTAGVDGGGRHWSGSAAAVSAFDAKADAIALIEALGLSADKVQITTDAPAWFHPGRSGTIRQGPKTVIGWFGEFHPAVLEELDVSGPLAGFEIILEAIPEPKARATRTRPPLALSDLQPVRRDFAFLLDRSVAAAAVMRAAKGADRKLISDVSVFDVFESEAIGADRKSLAIEVVLQPTEKTLTDEEIDATSAKIVAAVEKVTGGTLRT